MNLRKIKRKKRVAHMVVADSKINHSSVLNLNEVQAHLIKLAFLTS